MLASDTQSIVNLLPRLTSSVPQAGPHRIGHLLPVTWDIGEALLKN